jgi:hypothetical protein
MNKDPFSRNKDPKKPEFRPIFNIIDAFRENKSSVNT